MDGFTESKPNPDSASANRIRHKLSSKVKVKVEVHDHRKKCVANVVGATSSEGFFQLKSFSVVCYSTYRKAVFCATFVLQTVRLRLFLRAVDTDTLLQSLQTMCKEIDG